MFLPKLMVVTQRNLMRPNFFSALSLAVEGGARLIQLREKELARDGILDLAHATKTICDAHSAQLLVNGNSEIAQETGAGLHLPESNSCASACLSPGREYSCGQSVHSLEAAQRAQNEGADYVVFGSVFPTASHVGSTPKGLKALREITREISIPVFAIGGISHENCVQCLEFGAHGVAVVRAVWQSEDICEAVEKFNRILNG